MDYKSYIETNPQIMRGKPVFANTRIPVDLILEKLAEGMSVEEIIESYPNLTPPNTLQGRLPILLN